MSPPPGTSYAQQPGNFPIVRMQENCSRESLTQVSNDVIPIRAQISQFVDANDDVYVEKCLNELNRRAKELDCLDFECSIERFKELATEDGSLKKRAAQRSNISPSR